MDTRRVQGIVLLLTGRDGICQATPSVSSTGARVSGRTSDSKLCISLEFRVGGGAFLRAEWHKAGEAGRHVADVVLPTNAAASIRNGKLEAGLM